MYLIKHCTETEFVPGFFKADIEIIDHWTHLPLLYSRVSQYV